MDAADPREARGISPYSSRYFTAIHEAAHAVAGYLRGVHNVESLTLQPFEENGIEILGRVTYKRITTLPADLTPQEVQLLAEWIMRSAVCVALAGDAATDILLGELSRVGNLTDYEQAYKCACYLTGETEENDARAVTIMGEEWQVALAIARDYTAAIEAVAADLSYLGTINGARFNAIMELHGCRNGDLAG